MHHQMIMGSSGNLGPAEVQGLVAVAATVSKGYDLDWHIGFGMPPAWPTMPSWTIT
jgi:hypothetical protein